MKTKRIKYQAWRHEITGKFVSNAYAKRYPQKVERVTISYTLRK